MIILKETCGIPLYLQIYQQIRDNITAGKILSRSKLPSCRWLAKDLHVSRNTVELAYQQLCAEGYLANKPRSGFYVEELEPGLVSTTKTGVQEAGEEERKCNYAAESSVYKYDFRYGKLDVEHFPFSVWGKLMNQCLRADREEFMSYRDRQGEWGLRVEVMHYLAAFRGVKCLPEQIIISGGTQHCLRIICQLLKGQGGAVAMEEPGYDGARAVFRNHGLQVIPVSLEADGINIAELVNSTANVVYVTPSHQFPTGIILPIAKRLKLLDWAKQRNGFIIEDDYSCHLRYNIKPIPTLQGISGNGHVIYVGSFSKSLSPSLRIAYMVLPPVLLDTYREAYKEYDPAVPFLLQKTLERFMELGYWERHLRKTTQMHKRKHDLLIRSLQKYLGKQIIIYGQNAGLHVMIKVKGGFSEQELIDRAAKAGVGVYPVSRHWAYPENYANNMVLLGFSGVREDDIDHGVKLLSEAWQEF